MCILDLSEVFICEFHYFHIKSKYSKNSKVLLTGANSLVYEINAKDVYDYSGIQNGCIKTVCFPETFFGLRTLTQSWI